MSSLLFLVFRLSRENSQPENMYDIIFEKTEGVYAEATVQRVLLKRSYQKFTSKHLLESHFLIKLNSIDLQLLLKGDSSAGVFL